MLAATEHLVITYAARDERTNLRRPPAVPLGELLDVIDRSAQFGDDVATSLGERGHDVRVVEAWSDLMGHAQCIALDDGILLGGSDPRADGAALGV